MKCFPCLLKSLMQEDAPEVREAVSMVAGTAVCKAHAIPEELDGP